MEQVKINNTVKAVTAFLTDREQRWASEEHISPRGVDTSKVETAVKEFFAHNQPMPNETVREMADWFILCQNSFARYLND